MRAPAAAGTSLAVRTGPLARRAQRLPGRHTSSVIESPAVAKAAVAFPRALDVLGYEGLAQTAGFLDDERRATLEQLAAAGVPADWRRVEGDDVDVSWSDYR